jgi:hypothetical protein
MHKMLFIKDHSIIIYQQQFAGIVCLTFWHFTQTNSTSLQPSMTQGSQQSHPVVHKRQQPQAIATVPTVFLAMCEVFEPQNWQAVPSLSSLLIWIMVGPVGGGTP